MGFIHSLTGYLRSPLLLTRPLVGAGDPDKDTDLPLGTRGLMRETVSVICCPWDKSHQCVNGLGQFLRAFQVLGVEDGALLRSRPQQLGLPEGSTGRGVQEWTLAGG